MEQQFVGVGDVLDIEQFHLRVVLGIEMLVHILQHVFDADLLAVADTPHAVELQSLDDGTLQDEHGCGTRAADEIGALWTQVRNRQREDAVVVAVQQTDAVRTYQGCPVAFAGVEDTLFEGGALLRLLTEAC